MQNSEISLSLDILQAACLSSPNSSREPLAQASRDANTKVCLLLSILTLATDPEPWSHASMGRRPADSRRIGVGLYEQDGDQASTTTSATADTTPCVATSTSGAFYDLRDDMAESAQGQGEGEVAQVIPCMTSRIPPNHTTGRTTSPPNSRADGRSDAGRGGHRARLPVEEHQRVLRGRRKDVLIGVQGHRPPPFPPDFPRGTTVADADGNRLQV